MQGLRVTIRRRDIEWETGIASHRITPGDPANIYIVYVRAVSYRVEVSLGVFTVGDYKQVPLDNRLRELAATKMIAGRFARQGVVEIRRGDIS